MKPKILFLLGTLDSGGVAKSLVSTIRAIDYQKYEVHLYIIGEFSGPFTRLIPKETIIHNHKCSSCAVAGVEGLKWLLFHCHFLLFIGSLIRLLVSRFSKSLGGWILSRLLTPLKEDFDLIVDYNGQQQLYFMVDRLKGRKKISFFHSDYDKWPYYKSMDKRYYPKVDAIFTISSQCVDSMKRNFPEVANRVQLFENISSPAVINKMANENIKTVDSHGHIFVTIGHVWKNKGIDLAIDAAKKLRERGFDFTWLFIGKVAETEWLEVVEANALHNNMKFLGVLSNPYPYMKMADIIVHPSRFEGKSIALDEAKILCKPIVVTNFSTVNDQFTDGVNASICEMYGNSLANSIQQLLEDKSISDRYVDYLKSHIVDNSSEINKLLDVI